MEEKADQGDITVELQELGRRLGAALQAALESDQSRNLQSQVSEGLQDLSRQVDETIKSARESEAAKDLGEQVHRVVKTARESDVAQDIERGLVRGLRELNEQLDKLIESLQPREAPEAPETPEE